MGGAHLIMFEEDVYVVVFLMRAFLGMLPLLHECTVYLVYVSQCFSPLHMSYLGGLDHTSVICTGADSLIGGGGGIIIVGLSRYDINCVIRWL